MRKYQKMTVLIFIIISYFFPCVTMEAVPKWRTAYYANQAPFSTTLPLSSVPWNKYTHIIQSSIKPTFNNNTPGIDTTSYGIDGNKTTFVTTAHNNNTKALISLIVGGAQAAIMETNTNSTNIDSFVSVLTNFVTSNNYDGIDIDWEGINSYSVYQIQFPALITKLRTAMPTKTITVAGEIWLRNIYVTIHDKVDQINFMCYDMDGNYSGYASTQTWFNSCVRKGDNKTFGVASNNRSQEENLWYLSNTTIPTAKIGLGIPFYGRIKQGLRKDSTDGVTGPEQEYAYGDASTNPRTQISYHALLASDYWINGTHAWDNNYKAPYISYNVSGSANDAFVTYTNQQQIEESVKLVAEKNLGGIMTFSLDSEYIAGQAGDNRYPLSSAVFNNMLSLDNPDINIAYGRQAAQSSTHYIAIASCAVDGNTNGNYWNWSVTHTGLSGTNSWWEVDLQTECNIDEIKIWNRTDTASDRLSNYHAYIMDEARSTVWSSLQTDYPNPSVTLTPGGQYGRYIRISDPDILSLAEVQVYPKLNNVAEGKDATQSSTFSSATADLAVDGNTDGVYGNGSVTHTSLSGTNAWWKVDLGSEYNIGQIKIWNRTYVAMDRLSNYYVYILDANSNIVWINFQNDYPDPSITLTPGGINGRYVRISGPDILSLAEVQVIEY